MRIKILLCAVLFGCVGCGERSKEPAEKAEAHAGKPKSSWAVTRSSSGIDGVVSTASQTIRFKSDVVFLVEVSCKERGRLPSLSVQSVVGDPNSPDERSEIASTIALTGFVNEAVPVGRLKVADKEPTTLSPFFRIDDAYANKMEINGLFVRDLKFPMYIEMSNGAGQFEIHLEASEEVNQVLHECGVSVDSAQSPPSSSGEVVAEPSEKASSFRRGEELNPSFSCDRAQTQVEKLICSSRRLSSMDAAMDSNYRSMLASDLGGAENELKQTQRSWIAKRNACQDLECLERAYALRLDEVCEYPVASGIHPECLSADEVQ